MNKVIIRFLPCVFVFLQIALCLQFVTKQAYAVTAHPKPISITQPGGVKLEVFLRGDEHRNWAETSKGYTIVKNLGNNTWEYAIQDSQGRLLPSGIAASPDSTPPDSIKPHLMPPVRNKILSKPMRRNSAPGPQFGNWDPQPLSGSQKLLVIMVEFADCTLTTTEDDWSDSIFSTEDDVKSVANFYADNSFDTFGIEPVAHIQAGNPAGIVTATLDSDHPNYGGDITYDEEIAWINDALEAAADYVNFDALDVNLDGTLETDEVIIYFVMAGYEASGSINEPSIWAHAWGPADLGDVTAGGLNIPGWAVNGELNDYDFQHPMGVIAHELGHSMCGLPDLYDIDYGNSGLGIFSLMAQGSWGCTANEFFGGTTPVSLDAWSRQYLGWSDPRVPTVSGEVLDFGPALDSDDAPVKLTKPSVSTDQYFLVENRYNVGWDEGMESLGYVDGYGFYDVLGDDWGGGLLIMHIDETIGLPAFYDINSSSYEHQGVMAEEASTSAGSLFEGDSYGDVTHLFYSGNNDSFTYTTTPNSRLYDDTLIYRGLIDISDKSDEMTATFFTLDAPVFDPEGGAYALPLDITVTCATPGAVIHYTTNGDTPDENDPIVASGGMITLSSVGTFNVKALAFTPDGEDTSTLTSEEYVMREPIVVYVKPDGDNTKSGLTWALAKRTVQAGIAAGDEVWVKTGTYTENITLAYRKSIYGGFAGTETSRSNRNLVANVSILDGGGAGSVITAPSGITPFTVVDGFTIRNGDASTGGGIFCNGLSDRKSSPTILHNTITDNTAFNGGGGIFCYYSASTISNNTISDNRSTTHGGGGIQCSFSPSVTISKNVIAENTSYQGAGIACYNSNAAIYNNTITSNIAVTNYGGGIHCYFSAPSIRNNVIAKNTAWRGGGISCYYSSVPTILNNTIVENTASMAGGGIYTLAGTETPDEPLPITNNIIAFNSSGICKAAGVAELKSNCVYGNTGYNYLGLTASDYASDKQQDPKFVDKTAGNYHIKLVSPCLNSGANSEAISADKDMDLQSRINSIRVDIGADEYTKPSCDLNKDGKDDLVSLDADGDVWYSLNRTSWTEIPGVLNIASLAIGDLNGDQNDDIAGLCANGELWYTTDKSAWTNIPGEFASIVTGDFDGDGLADIAATDDDNHISYTTDKSTWTSIPGSITQLAAGDFDGDGLDDLVGLSPSGSIYYTLNRSTWTKIAGTMTSVITGDFNGDGLADIAGRGSSGKIYYSINRTSWINIPGTLSSITVGDINSDGLDDIAGLGTTGKVYYSTNRTSWVNIPGTMSSIVTGDFNGNHYDDIAGRNSSGNIYYSANKTSWVNIPGTFTKIYSAR